MCEVKITACRVCCRVFQAKLLHCLAARNVLRWRDESAFEIVSSFHWSPMADCHGLRIHHLCNFQLCPHHSSSAAAAAATAAAAGTQNQQLVPANHPPWAPDPSWNQPSMMLATSRTITRLGFPSESLPPNPRAEVNGSRLEPTRLPSASTQLQAALPEASSLASANSVILPPLRHPPPARPRATTIMFLAPMEPPVPRSLGMIEAPPPTRPSSPANTSPSIETVNRLLRGADVTEVTFETAHVVDQPWEAADVIYMSRSAQTAERPNDSPDRPSPT